LTDITTAPAEENTHADPAPTVAAENASAEHGENCGSDPAAAKTIVPEETVGEPAGSVVADAMTADEAAYHDEEAAEPNGFADLGLSPEILRAIDDMGYRTPTPIQAQAIPTVLMARDVLGCAQTGTGKTASFVLPLMDILSGSRARARMPRSLILEPTRELALQVAENFVQYGKYLKLNHALLIGGESLSDQKEALMKGVDVLIATPGRLMDLFDRGGLLLTDTKILVIDEADRMLDMGFIPDIEKIVGFLPKARQTLLFSATMAPEIRRLADAFLSNPKEITVSRPASVASTIVAGLTVVEDGDKREALRRLIRSEDVQNALIFCNRKRDVDILYKSLKRHGFSVGSLHGDMSQPERFATLAKFKANEIRLLVCSDVAARGLDIGGLSHVFNFDVPIHAEDYVHRIGRTGRAGLTGHAFTLAAPDDRQFVDAIERLIGAPIPRMQVDGMEEVAFAEDDGKRRRGRGRGTKVAVRAPKAAKPAAEPVTNAEAAPKVAKPRRSRAKKVDTVPLVADARQPDAVTEADNTVASESVPMAETVTAPVIAEAPAAMAAVEQVPVARQTATGRAEPRRGGRHEPRRDEVRQPDVRAPDLRAGDSRNGDRNRPRDGRRRDEDLGPSVLGFGDDVPAFMLLRSRANRRPTSEPIESE